MFLALSFPFFSFSFSPSRCITEAERATPSLRSKRNPEKKRTVFRFPFFIFCRRVSFGFLFFSRFVVVLLRGTAPQGEAIRGGYLSICIDGEERRERGVYRNSASPSRQPVYLMESSNAARRSPSKKSHRISKKRKKVSFFVISFFFRVG